MADSNPEIPEKTDGTASPEKAQPKTGVLIVYFVSFMVMVLTPLICYLVVRSTVPPQIDKNRSALDGEKSGEVTLNLEPVIVNIAETRGTRMLKVTVHLVLSEERLKTQLEDSHAMLKDRVQKAVSRKNLEDLDGEQGRESLKRDIMAEINNTIRDRMSGSVINVYFSEYLVQ